MTHIWIYFRRNQKIRRVHECNEFCCWYWVAAQMDLSSCSCRLMLMHVHWKENVIHNICTEICIIVGTRVTLVLGLQKYSLLVLSFNKGFVIFAFNWILMLLWSINKTIFNWFFSVTQTFSCLYLFRLDNMPPKFDRNQI